MVPLPVIREIQYAEASTQPLPRCGIARGSTAAAVGGARCELEPYELEPYANMQRLESFTERVLDWSSTRMYGPDSGRHKPTAVRVACHGSEALLPDGTGAGTGF